MSNYGLKSYLYFNKYINLYKNYVIYDITNSSKECYSNTFSIFRNICQKEKKYTIYFMKNGLERKMFYKKYLSVEL